MRTSRRRCTRWRTCSAATCSWPRPRKLMARVQEVVVDEQVQACLAAEVACPHCRRPRRHKDGGSIAVRTLFGTLRLPSPRWHHCYCRSNDRQSFSLLTEVLPERTTPELLYLEARFAGLIVVRTERQPPGRAPAARTFIASHLGPPSRPGHGAAPGGGAGTRAGDVHRGLPQGLGRSWRSRTCRSRSASTAGTSMPATSDLAVRGGST